MLSLDDPRWGDLRTSRGRGADVPALVRRIEAEPWSGLIWTDAIRLLCDRYEVSSAAYAVIPHIVPMITRHAVADRDGAFAFVAMVAACEGDPVPDDLLPELTLGFAAVRTLVLDALLRVRWKGHSTEMLAALAAVAGRRRLGRELLLRANFPEYGEDARPASCPTCHRGVGFYFDDRPRLERG